MVNAWVGLRERSGRRPVLKRQRPPSAFRKENLDFEVQQLREERAAAEANRARLGDLERLLDLATDLAGLYAASPPAEKRRMLWNCLEDRTVQLGRVVARPADWLTELTRLTTGAGDPQSAAVLLR